MTIETIFGFGVILIFFSVVSIFVLLKNNSTIQLDRDYAAENYCKKIALTLSDVYNYGHGSKWNGSIDANVFIGKNFVDMNYITGPAYCLHFADLNNPGTRLNQGKIAFENIKSKVVVRNG